MQNPIVAVKQKIEDHKVLLASTTGVVVGSAATVIIMQKLPTKLPNMVMNVPQTVVEIQAMLEKYKAIEIVTPDTDQIIALLPSDYKS